MRAGTDPPPILLTAAPLLFRGRGTRDTASRPVQIAVP
tara:strand:- start:374 stop:487 length:114 start_codon:yes stop_codon:yes gene_type:complete